MATGDHCRDPCAELRRHARSPEKPTRSAPDLVHKDYRFASQKDERLRPYGEPSQVLGVPPTTAIVQRSLTLGLYRGGILALTAIVG